MQHDPGCSGQAVITGNRLLPTKTATRPRPVAINLPSLNDFSEVGILRLQKGTNIKHSKSNSVSIMRL